MQHTLDIGMPEPGRPLNIGMVGTVRHDDESWTRYLLTIPPAIDPLRREHESLPVISTRHYLGSRLLGKKVGEEIRYVDEAGRERRAWLEGIEDEPVRQGKGSSERPKGKIDLPANPWEPRTKPRRD
jgi:transcription elongation GreA/GreB family factor